MGTVAAGISLFGKLEKGLRCGSRILESPVLKPWNGMCLLLINRVLETSF